MCTYSWNRGGNFFWVTIVIEKDMAFYAAIETVAKFINKIHKKFTFFRKSSKLWIAKNLRLYGWNNSKCLVITDCKSTQTQEVGSMSQSLMSIDEVANWLNLKISTVRYLVFVRRIPYLKLGKSIRFNRLDIEAWLDSNKSQLAQEMAKVQNGKSWATNEYNLETECL